MKRVSAALLLAAAIVLTAAGCTNDPSGSQPAGAEALPSPPPPEVTESDGGSADSVSTESGEQEPTDEVMDASLDEDDSGGFEFGSEILPQSDDRMLEDSDLEHLNNWQLTLARNEIFARHGRPFMNEHLRDYFVGQPWYSPDENYENAWLSATEQANAQYIVEYQELKYEIPARHP